LIYKIQITGYLWVVQEKNGIPERVEGILLLKKKVQNKCMAKCYVTPGWRTSLLLPFIILYHLIYIL
jgi:hypothetical protein